MSVVALQQNMFSPHLLSHSELRSTIENALNLEALKLCVVECVKRSKVNSEWSTSASCGHLLVSQLQLVAKTVATLTLLGSFLYFSYTILYYSFVFVPLFVILQPWPFLLVSAYDRKHFKKKLCLGLL